MNYGGTSLGTAGDHTSFSPAYSSGSLLRGQYSALVPTDRLVCAAGTLEFVWYWRHWLRGRLGTGQVISRGSLRIYRADYTPTSGNGAEYLFLAYCTLDLGPGGGKTYSTPVDLLGRKAKEEAPFSQATRVTVSYSSSASFSNFTAKNTTRSLCDPSSRANSAPSWQDHCLEWDGFSGATAFYLRRQYVGVTASTTCTDATVLADERWYPYTVHTEGSKMRLTASLAAVQHDGPTGYSTDFACYQVQARNGTTVVGTSSALHLAFGENGAITAIDGTAISSSGQSDPLANLPAEVTLSTSPTTVPEGTAVMVTATLSRSLSAAVTIPLTVTRGTSEDGDHGTLSGIMITGGSLSGSGTITTTSDGDGDDETFTVAVTTANLPSGVSGGSPVSRTVTITDIHEGEVSTDPIFPSAPATLTARAGDQQVVLSWGGVLLARGWEYSKDNGSTWTTTGSTTNGTTVTGLSNGTAYNFKVRAMCQLPAPFPSQTGRASSTASATPVAGNAPTGQPTVSGTERVGHVLTAATSGIADQDGLSSPGWTYQWVRVEEGSTNTNITGATSASYTLSAADAGKKVRVSFTDDGNTAHTLESVDSGVIAAAHTTAPDPVAAVNVTHKGNSLEVSWNAPARASHYDVTYSGGGVNARAAWNRAGTSLTIRCDSREGYENRNCVNGGTVYTVGVRARNTVGTSAWVNSASTAATTAPTLAATNGATLNGTTVTLTFNENLATASGLTSSAFTVKKNSSSTAETLSGSPTVSGKTVTLTLATPALSTDTFTLSYAKPSSAPARLRDAANNEVGAFTNQAVANKTVATTAPDPVAAVNVTYKGSSLEVSWAAPARATHYDVTYSGGGVNARAAWNRAGTSITITCDSREGYENQHCISGGTAYTVAVRARNAVGTSAWVNSAQAMLPVPEAVASVTAVHRGSSLVVT